MFVPRQSTLYGSVNSYLVELNVTVVYELYDAAPVMSKWVEISPILRITEHRFMIENLTTEILAVNCDHSPQAEKNHRNYISGLLHVDTTSPHASYVSWYTHST